MHNTGNPLPSKDILDLYDNSEVVDNFVNSQQDEVPDRFGTKRLTLAGLIKRSMALRNEINDFSGALTFRPEWSDVPMNVSEGVGGEGGALNLQAEALGNRSEINKITSREALRRTYQEVGLNLVDGSFEQGATITSTTDVVLHEKTGRCYSGPIGEVPKGTDPLSGSFVDKTNELSVIGFINVKSHGAVGDSITDDYDSITAAANRARAENKTLFFPYGTYYTSRSLDLGGIHVLSFLPGKTDPYYGLKPDGTNFITGNKSSDWRYYYNNGIGTSKTWRDHLDTKTNGTIIISDVASPIITCKVNERFNLDGIGVVGNHRLVGQDGIAFPKENKEYRGNRHIFKNIIVTGCGNHGLALYSGWETSDFKNSSFYANNGAGVFTGILRNSSSEIQDSATEYLTVADISASHNRLGGLVFSTIRKHVSFNNVSGNNNGQYDSPTQSNGKIDPLLGYDRSLPTGRGSMSALIDILDGTVDTVGQKGTMIDLSFNNIWGEQIAILIKISCLTGNGVITNLGVNNCTATRLGQINVDLDSVNNGCLLYISCKYFSGLTWTGNYNQSLKPIDVENVTEFGVSDLLIPYQPKTSKEYLLAKTRYRGSYRANTIIADKPFIYEDYPGEVAAKILTSNIIKDTHTFYPQINLLAPISKWRIYAQHQSTNGDNWGLYELHVFRDNKGFYKSVVKELINSGSFTAPPTVSNAGILSIPINPFSMVRVELIDENGWIGF